MATQTSSQLKMMASLENRSLSKMGKEATEIKEDMETKVATITKVASAIVLRPKEIDFSSRIIGIVIDVLNLLNLSALLIDNL